VYRKQVRRRRAVLALLIVGSFVLLSLTYRQGSDGMQRGVSAVTTGAKLITFIDAMMAENKAAADPECRFTPAYTTLHVGVVKGGTAVNIISRQCSFTWDIRTLPGDSWRRYLDRFQAYADAHGLKVRPHIKTHKLPAIAEMQLKAGAIGITCQKVSEAEAMIEGSPHIRDVLITYNILGTEKLEHLAALATDSGEQALEVSAEPGRQIVA